MSGERARKIIDSQVRIIQELAKTNESLMELVSELRAQDASANEAIVELMGRCNKLKDKCDEKSAFIDQQAKKIERLEADRDDWDDSRKMIKSINRSLDALCSRAERREEQDAVQQD